VKQSRIAAELTLTGANDKLIPDNRIEFAFNIDFSVEPTRKVTLKPENEILIAVPFPQRSKDGEPFVKVRVSLIERAAERERPSANIELASGAIR
jgi:hypothetical protein